MANVLTRTLTATLQQSRKARRVSQLELGLRMGVSQRHVSFVESGRAQPSRELLANWLHALDVPLARCNAALLELLALCQSQLDSKPNERGCKSTPQPGQHCRPRQDVLACAGRKHAVE